MALIGNYSVLNKTPGRWLAGNSTAHASQVGQGAHLGCRSNWGNTGARRNMAFKEGVSVLELLAIPSGYGGAAILMPIKAGGISSHNEIQGAGTATATLVSLQGTSAGTATATASIAAPTAAVGTSTGSATVTGVRTAIAWCYGASAGTGTASLVRYATGKLVGSIAPAVDLEASSFSTWLLDEEDVETGVTLREALRIVLSANGGKVAISGDTVTIRDVNDTVDRIVATTDSNGQRTVITLDTN